LAQGILAEATHSCGRRSKKRQNTVTNMSSLKGSSHYDSSDYSDYDTSEYDSSESSDYEDECPQGGIDGREFDGHLPTLLNRPSVTEVQDKMGKAGDFGDYVDLAGKAGAKVKAAVAAKRAAADAAAAAAATDAAADAATGAAAASGAAAATEASRLGTAVAKGTTALGYVGAAAAGLKVCTSGYALIMEDGDPEKVSEKLKKQFEQLLKEFESEPQSLAKTAMMKELQELYAEAHKLGAAKKSQHTKSNTANIVAGVAGVCAFAFASVPAAPVLAFGLAVDAQDWDKQSELRSRVMKLVDNSVYAQANYAKKTGRRTEGLLGTPGEFSYRGSKWCKTFMLVEFELYDGQPDKRSSLDCENCGHFEGKMRLPPGAINVKIRFDVWGGATVDAVNRRTEDFEWLEGRNWRNSFYGYRYQEVFTFPKGDDIRAEFILEGTSLHRYVEEAKATNIRTQQRWLL